MPCTDGSEYGPKVSKEAYDEQVAENAAMKKRLDAATRAACDALRYLEQNDLMRFNTTRATQAWWVRHKKEDDIRLKKCAAKKKKRKAAIAEINELVRKGKYASALEILNGLEADDES